MTAKHELPPRIIVWRKHGVLFCRDVDHAEPLYTPEATDSYITVTEHEYYCVGLDNRLAAARKEMERLIRVEDQNEAYRLTIETMRDEHAAALSEAVRVAEKKNWELVKIISWLKRGDCFCEFGIGNPMMRGHSVACLAASAALVESRAAQMGGNS